MPVDPSIALNVKPFQLANPLEQFGQFQQAQTAMTQNRLAELALGQKQDEYRQTRTLNDAFKSSIGENGVLDRNRLYGMVAAAGLGSKVAALQKDFADQDYKAAQAGELASKTAKSDNDLKESKRQTAMTDIAALTSPEHALASLAAHEKAGDLSPEMASAVRATIPQNPADFPTWQIGMLRRIMKAGDAAKYTAPDSNTIANNQRIVSEGQANRATQLQVQQMIEKRQKSQGLDVAHGAKGLTAEQNDALFGENGAVTTGRLDPNRINSRTAALYADAFLKNPNVDMAKISGDIALGRNATFRQNAMVADVLPEIMQNMVDAGKKVGFSDNRTIGKMQGWVKGELNDPDMTEYMTQRNDALMTVARVMRGVGMTDMAHKAETEVSSPTMSPAALDAWMRGQMKALQPRLDMNRRITRDQPHGEPAAGKAAAPSLPAKNSKGWTLQVDANGNRAYVSPDRNQWEEVK